MPATVNGIPLYPLVVHAVVVLVPLAALGAVVCVAWPFFVRQFGLLTLAVAVVGTAAVPLATDSGQQLRASRPTVDVTRHARPG